MSYQVLARKWRPKNFSQLMGQEHVVTVLVNALMQERLHHAYLFTGTRGVGKTTIARIFAKSLNCQEGITSQPCGKCDVCEDIDIGRFVDLIEIDAASRTKVDDTREILDNVQYAPSRGRFKVYLIDEVHMLSKSSFNALLKTLEEPPPHVKFILATTDPQKLPVTVLSRCLQFHLKALTPQQIETKLNEILSAENVTFEDGALGLLAKAARGSMRDSLSLTDQAIAQGQGHIEVGNVQQMLGGVDQNWVFKILIALIKQDPKGLLELSKSIASFAPSYPRLMAELLQLLHQVALWQLVPNSVDADAQRSTLLSKFASAMAPEDVQLYYQIVLNGRKDLPYAGDEQAAFDMVILRLLAFRPANKTDVVKSESAQTARVSGSVNNSFDDIDLTDTINPVTQTNPVAKLSSDVSDPVKTEVQTQTQTETSTSTESVTANSAKLNLDQSTADDATDVFAVQRNAATSAEQLDVQQQALEEQAQQTFAAVKSQPPEDDLFADVINPDAEMGEQDNTLTQNAVIKNAVIENAVIENAAGENTKTHVTETQAAQTSIAEHAAPEAPKQSDTSQPAQSEVERMLSARNMLRSRKKASEGGAKKSEASIAAKAFSPRAIPAKNITDVEAAAVTTIDTAQQLKPALKASPTSVSTTSAPRTTAQSKPKADEAMRDISDIDASATLTVAAVENTHSQMSTEQSNTEQTSNEIVEDTQQLTDVNSIASGQFDESAIDPKTIRNANQIDVWANTIDAMGLTGRVRQLALNAMMGEDSNDEQLVINLDKQYAHLNSDAALQQITKCYVRLKQMPSEVIINNVDIAGATPIFIQQRIDAKRLQYAQSVISNDKFINALQEEFSAVVEENSIEPL